MRAWQFDEAMDLLEGAQAVLDRRVFLEEQARAAGLQLSPRLELAFESDAGFDVALSEADAQAQVMEMLEAAEAARPPDPAPLEQLGLAWETPDADLAAARAAFSSGDLSSAAHAAAGAEQAWLVAADLGRSRLATGIGIAILAVLAILVTASLLLDRRAARRRDRIAIGTADAPTAGEPGAG
jgi:hypothetical protein